MDEKLHAMRTDYLHGELTEEQAADDPIDQFRTWFEQINATEQPEPNAMTLATVADDGQPAARVMLLKHFDADGFVFFTDYESRKGRELDGNPRAAVCFWWAAQERQVRIEGRVERVAAEMSDTYFASRPRPSQISANVSRQSVVVPDRNFLENATAEFEGTLSDGAVLPRPDRWGGYRIVPTCLEFWQGRGARLHDRLRYTRTPSGWRRERLSP